MKSCIFTNDNNVEILLPEHIFSDIFPNRDYSEVYFRRIHTYMINNNIIDTTKNIIAAVPTKLITFSAPVMISFD